jgi:UDP-glucuronate decarboxylase
MEKIKNILVASGAGFIGSHLCKRLLKKNVNVICVDNLSTSTTKNINSFLSKDNFLFVKVDITCDLKKKLNKWPFKFDEIYNLTCAASPQLYQKNPI